MHSKSGVDDVELAKRISAMLLSRRSPMALKEIIQELKDVCVNHETINSLVSKYQEHFQLYQEPLVRLVTKISICNGHCRKGVFCSGQQPECSGLHICKYKFLSGKCRFGKKCTFGHDLNTDHNKKILSDNLLFEISVDDLKYLLVNDDNRTALTVPRICKFYNVEKNKCRHTRAGSICPNLHICKHYVFGACSYGNTCHRSHELKNQVNLNIISKHGLDTSRPEEEIVLELRKVLSCKTGETSTARGDGLLTAREVKDQTMTPISEKDSDLQSLTVIKKEETSVEEESVYVGSDSEELHIKLITDTMHFRYLSELTAIEKRKSNMDTLAKNGVADVWVDNYHGNATVIAHCVDSSDKVHQYCLHGQDCKDGVFVKTCQLENGNPVLLQGISVCTPTKIDAEKSVQKTISCLQQHGVSGVQRCEKSVDKNCVYLKVTVLLEDGIWLNKLIGPLQNKKTLKQTESLKRRAESPSNRESKRRIKNASKEKTVEPFRRSYSRQRTEDEWGNFIDTTGFQESALTWKAHGDALQSVCMICYPGGSGTGFRVGTENHYIMTAAHVYDYIVQSGCNTVGRRQRNPLKNPEVYAVFGYLRDGEVNEQMKFRFKGKVHFKNDETDTVILELEENTHGTPMPPALQYFQTPDCIHEFFFVGHSEGKPLAINKVDKLVDISCSEAQEDIKNIRAISLKHTKCSEYPKGREYEVQPFHCLDNPNRFLFHCKFTKGASGSPGLVFLNDGRIVVVSILLRGFPNWYYDPDPNMNTFRSSWSKDAYCVEQGANLLSVHTIMKKERPELDKEIFGFD